MNPMAAAPGAELVPSAIFGTFIPFDHEKDQWRVYSGRLKQFFLTVGIADDKRKKSALLNYVGPATYRLLFDLCSPTDPGDKSYEELCALMETHFTMPLVVFKERKDFYSATRRDGESVQDWLVRIRALASNCRFGDRLEAILLDKFVVGQSGRSFARLCEEEETITLKKAMELSMKYDGRTMGSVSDAEDFNFVQKKSVNAGSACSSSGQRGKKKTAFSASTLSKNENSGNACIHCGYTTHHSGQCRFKYATCHACRKLGHLASVCRTSSRANFVEEVSELDEPVQEDKCAGTNFEYVHNISSFSNVKPVTVDVVIESIHHTFQIDSGAAISAISESEYERTFCGCKLISDSTVLRGYTGEIIVVVGAIFPRITCNNVTKKFKILVVRNGGPPILGRNFCVEFKLTEIRICNISASAALTALVDEFTALFEDTLGCLKNVKIHLSLSETAVPLFCKPRVIPFAFRDKIEESIKDYVKCGMLSSVEHSQWGTPLVPILKPDGNIRICADYKTTVNKFVEDVNYPLPLISDIFARLGGNSIFSKLDMKFAYNQLELDDETKRILTWSTPFGIFTMNRLPFGVKPAAAVFQREIEKVLMGIPGVLNYLDDIIIAAPNLDEHNRRLRVVFERLLESGLKLNKQKCVFARSSVQYLGHTISGKGLHKLDVHIKSVLQAPQPQNASEVKSFVGLANYYGKFIPNISSKLCPLYHLLKAGADFKWSDQCQLAFEQVKRDIVSDTVLTHFDLKKPIVLTCDASKHGIGAVLAHLMPDGSQRPIAFASRTLSSAEVNYGVIHKEALAIVFGTKKFFQYLIGNHFTLITDHKPLLAVFGEKKGIPQVSAARLQRWAHHLMAFDYAIKYVKSAENCADAWSRLPLKMQGTDETVEDERFSYVNYVHRFDPVPVDYRDVKKETESDAVLAPVVSAVLNCSMHKLTDANFEQFRRRENELSVENGILMWGYRVVIPQSLRKDILKQLHQSHLGIVKTKSVCRSAFWWPGLDKDIENCVNSCEACLSALPSPPSAPAVPWVDPGEPWTRLHVDYAGPFKGFYYFVVLDAHTKWLEVFPSNNMTSKYTIMKLRELFARFGLPQAIVSDNGTQFTSEAYADFLQNNGVKRILIPPGHPSSNGAAENSVKTVKNSIRKALFKEGDCSFWNISNVISRFLMDYRISEHCTTGASPSKLMLKRVIRTRLDLLKPPVGRVVEDMVASESHKFKENDTVIVRDYSDPNRQGWQNATILSASGSRWYDCKLCSGRVIKRHCDQIRKRLVSNVADFNKGNGKIESSSIVGISPQIVIKRNLEVDKKKDSGDNLQLPVNVPLGGNASSASNFTSSHRTEANEINERQNVPILRALRNRSLISKPDRLRY